jgi:hypothetical protein
MKRKSLIVIAVMVAVIGFVVAINWRIISMLVFGPYMGNVTDSWETSNQTFNLRVDRRTGKNSFVPGSYYVFQSAPFGFDAWREIMIFRHDDPVPIPCEQVRFVNDRLGYVFIG